MVHNRSTYVNKRCRCEECRAANREYKEARRATGVDNESAYKAASAWGKRNRYKSRAHGAVQRAVNKGTLVAPSSCERCDDSEARLHASHDDYSKQLEVEWLCPLCHVRKDRALCN